MFDPLPPPPPFPLPLCTVLCWWSEAQGHSLRVWSLIKKTSKVPYPAGSWAAVGRNVRHLFVAVLCPAPASCIIIPKNHHFLTPCHHFLVGAHAPPSPAISPVPLFSSPRLIIHQQPAGASGRCLSAGAGGCQPLPLAKQRFTIFYFHSVFVAFSFYASLLRNCH